MNDGVDLQHPEQLATFCCVMGKYAFMLRCVMWEYVVLWGSMRLCCVVLCGSVGVCFCAFMLCCGMWKHVFFDVLHYVKVCLRVYAVLCYVEVCVDAMLL